MNKYDVILLPISFIVSHAAQQGLWAILLEYFSFEGYFFSILKAKNENNLQLPFKIWPFLLASLWDYSTCSLTEIFLEPEVPYPAENQVVCPL